MKDSFTNATERNSEGNFIISDFQDSGRSLRVFMTSSMLFTVAGFTNDIVFFGLAAVISSTAPTASVSRAASPDLLGAGSMNLEMICHPQA